MYSFPIRCGCWVSPRLWALVPEWELLVSSKVTAGAGRHFPKLYKLVARLLEFPTPLPAVQVGVGGVLRAIPIICASIYHFTIRDSSTTIWPGFLPLY